MIIARHGFLATCPLLEAADAAMYKIKQERRARLNLKVR